LTNRSLLQGSIQGLEDDTSPLLMHSAVVYAQTDLTAKQLDDFDDDPSECSAEEQVEDTLLEWYAVIKCLRPMILILFQAAT
jgi:Fe-S-cluster formation regulator IscX/YfhJ